jgi:hypothetical protein
MNVLIEFMSFASIEAFLVKIPETAGILFFGLTLTGTAVLIRWLLGRGDTAGGDEGFEKKIY